ncbi:MAG: LysR family transcriptional regulator [Dehalococcoidia bacterium]
MNLTHLHTFQTVAQHGSYTRAAEALFLSQPSVYLQVRALERFYGQRLIEQIDRRATPTAAGRVLLGYAERIMALVDEARIAVDDSREGEPVGRLSIGSSFLVAAYLLPYLLSAYRRIYPRVELRTLRLSGYEIDERLMQGEIDLGIHSGAAQRSGIASRRFFADRLIAVAAPGHPLVGRRGVLLDELARYPFVDRTEAQPTSMTARDWLAARGVQTQSSLALPNDASVRIAARLGMGIAVLSTMLVVEDLQAGHLCMLDIDGLDMRLEMHVAWRSGVRLGRTTQLMLDLLADGEAVETALRPLRLPEQH